MVNYFSKKLFQFSLGDVFMVEYHHVSHNRKTGFFSIHYVRKSDLCYIYVTRSIRDILKEKHVLNGVTSKCFYHKAFFTNNKKGDWGNVQVYFEKQFCWILPIQSISCSNVQDPLTLWLKVSAYPNFTNVPYQRKTKKDCRPQNRLKS